MTLQIIFEKYINLLWQCFEYDVDVFSKWWMYAILVIPAIAYFVFFLFKWFVLTAPIWIPLNIGIKGLGNMLSVFIVPIYNTINAKKKKIGKNKK